MQTTPDIETEIRLALAVPEPDPAFLSSLRQQVSRAHSTRATRFAWAGLAISAIFLLAIILIVGPATVFAEFRSLLGYIPGVGLVQNDASLRILAEPVKIERNGITVQVLEGAADPQHTVLVFQVDGIPQSARPTNENIVGCSEPFTLQTANGSPMKITGGDGNGWGTGYSARVTFPALPDGSSSGTLVIPCLQDTLPGSVPENWQIPLRFKPAPADMQVFPVYDLAASTLTQTPTVLAPTPLLVVQTQIPQVNPNSATVAGIRLTLEQVMESENGFILKGSTSWKGMENMFVDGFGPGAQLLDGRGTVIPIGTYSDQQGGPLENQTSVWGFQTNSKAYPGPWKLSIPSMIVYLTTNQTFELELGPAPKPGQTLDLNMPLTIAGHTLVVQKAEIKGRLDGTILLDFTFGGDPELFDVSVRDPDNHSARISGTGSTAESGAITSAFSYDQLPSGKRKIVITRLSYLQQGPWILGWQPPASSAGLAVPTPMPLACLTEEKWQHIRGLAPGELPPGVGGTLLVQQSTGQLMPQISLIQLGTGQKQVIAIGAWSSLSPDGSWVGYGEGNGKSILIAPTDGGKPHALAGTTERDSSPLWSPDGNWIAFTRSNDGIYIVHPDGSGLKRLTAATLQARPVGWMPDSRALAIAVMTAKGEQLESMDIATGAVQTWLTVDNLKSGFKALSADGRQVAFSEKIFGRNYPGAWIANLEGSGRKLIAALESAMSTVSTWSPDGKWVVVTVLESKRDTTIETLLLVQPETCQVALLPGISGTITGWR
jgi:hypothetical protein